MRNLIWPLLVLMFLPNISVGQSNISNDKKYVVTCETSVSSSACSVMGIKYSNRHLHNVDGRKYSETNSTWSGSNSYFSSGYSLLNLPKQIYVEGNCSNDCTKAFGNINISSFTHYTQKNFYAKCQGGGPHLGVKVQITPLLNIGYKDPSRTITCVDLNDPASSKGIEVKLFPKDKNLPQNDRSVHFYYSIQYAFVKPSDGSINDWKYVKSHPSQNGTYTIYYKDINDPSILGKELKFRVRQSFTVKKPTSLYYESKSISGIYFLEKPHFTNFSYTPPLCAETYDASMKLTFPKFSKPGTNYLITISRYTTDPSGSLHGPEEYIDKSGKSHKVYFQDGFTSNYTMPAGTNSIDISNTTLGGILSDANKGSRPLKLYAGIYRFKVFINDGSHNSLCPNIIWEEIKPPPRLELSLSPQPIAPGSPYHTKIKGGTGSVVLNASGGADGVKYLYKKLESDAYIPLEGNTISLDNISNGTTFYLSNANNCQSVSKTVSFVEPDPLELTIESAIKPTCHSGDLSDGANTKSDGSIKFSAIGGIKPYKVKLEELVNEVWTDAGKDPVNNVFSGLSEGTYQVVLSDAYSFETNNEQPSAKINLTPIELTASNPSDVVLQCKNDKTTITIPGLVDGNLVEYKLTTSDTYKKLEKTTQLVSGIYSYKVSRAGGECYELLSNTITQPSTPLSIKPIKELSDTCGAGRGSVALEVSGGWADADSYPYYIAIEKDGIKTVKTITTGAINNIKFDKLSAGKYNVEVRSKYTNLNTYACKATNTFTIGQTNPLAVKVAGFKPVNCATNSDGAVTLKIENDNFQTYTYEVTNKLTNDVLTFDLANKTVSNLSAATYNFEIKENERGCIASIVEYNLPVRPDPISFSRDPDVKEATCSIAKNGSITALTAGGVGTPVFKLFNGDINQKTGVLTAHHSPNTYTLTVTDLSPNTYTLTVTDEAGCSAEKSVTVNALTNPIEGLRIKNYGDQYCTDGNKGYIEVEASYGGTSNELTYTLTNSISLDATTYTNPTTPVRFDKLDSGEYMIRMQDKDGCYKVVSQEIKNKGYTPKVTKQVTNPLSCSMAKNGAIDIKVKDYDLDDAGGVFTYAFKDALGNSVMPTNSTRLVNSYTSLNNQAYSLEVTDAFNCVYSEENIKVGVSTNAIKLSTPLITKPSCATAHNGIIEVSATGGLPINTNQYTFTLLDQTNAALNQTITGVSARFEGLYPNHSYTIQVKDAEDCSHEIIQGTLGVKSNVLTIDAVSASSPKCKGYADGSITAVIKHDNDTRTQYTYQLFKADASKNYTELANPSFDLSTGVFSGLSHGLYQVKVSGNDNCESTYAGISVTEPEPIKVLSSSYSCISTHGQKTGVFSITISQGSQKYTTQWVKPDGTVEEQNISSASTEYTYTKENLSPGEYTFRVKDQNQCTYFGTSQWYETKVNITQPEAPLTVSFTKKDETCATYHDGQITVSASGGWLCATNDHSGCTNSAHTNCPNWKDYTCGAQDYVYARNGGAWQCSNVFTGAAPGIHTIVVMDKAGNKASVSVEIAARPPLSIKLIESFPASCPGYNNGRIAATIENGVLIGDKLDYTIFSEPSKEVYTQKADDRALHFGKLKQGQYTLQVTDQNSCSDKQVFTINEPQVPEIGITHNYIRKKGDATGEINVSIAKGNGVFNYEWIKDGGTPAYKSGQTTQDIVLTNLLAGTYTLRVQDTAKCVYETTDWMQRDVQILEPEKALSFEVIENKAVSCFGLSDGALELTPIGGWGEYTFSLNTQAEQHVPRYDNLVAGIYTITVKDKAGISWQKSLEVTQPDILTATKGSVSDVKCNGGSDGSITLNITGGNPTYQVSVDQISWYENNVAQNLSIGTYNVFVKDKMNCQTQVNNITLTQPGKIVLASSELIKSQCTKNEGQIRSSYSGGVGPYTYSWKKDMVMTDGTIQIVDLPYTTPNISNLYSSRYLVEVKDAHGCIMPFEFLLDDDTDLTIETIAVTDVTCWGDADGKAKATVIRGNPGYTYTWSSNVLQNSNESAWGLKAGTYNLLVRDQMNCAVMQEFTVGTPDDIGYQIVDQVQPLCLGGAKGSLEIIGTGGTPAYQYAWNHGSAGNQLTGVIPGEYAFTITDAHNCQSSFTIPFKYQRSIKPDLGEDRWICHYNNLVLDGGAFNTFKWTSNKGYNSNQKQVTLTEPDTYYLEVSDADKCLGYDTLKLDVSYLKIADLKVKDVTCHGLGDGEANITVSPDTWAHTIEWTDGSANAKLNNQIGGNYSVRVFDAYGCEDTRVFTIKEPDAMALNVNKLMQPLCNGIPDGRIEVEAIGGMGNYRYQWLHGETKRRLSKLDAGSYVMDVYDANNCHLQETYVLDYARTISPKLGDDLIVCEGNSTKLYPGDFSKYQWFKGDVKAGNDTAIIVIDPDTYRVEVQDNDRCIGRDTLLLSTFAADLTPEFLTATSVAAGDTLIVVEVSKPKPQQIDWIFTGEHSIVEQGAYYCKVIFKEPGVREITLNAHGGSCSAQARKNILVTPAVAGDNNGGEGSAQAQQNLMKLSVAPNPTDGFFTVGIELNEQAPVNIYLVALGTGQIIENRNRQNSDTYSETYNLSIPGAYVVVVESKGEKRVAKVIVN